MQILLQKDLNKITRVTVLWSLLGDYFINSPKRGND